jgi:hypothetical protein
MANFDIGALLAKTNSVRFPATQIPDADANTLDDYEEGIFTPTVSFSGAAVGVVYGTRSGSYTKIGNRVMGECRVDLTNKGTSTGNASIDGIPFVPAKDSVVDVFVAGAYAGLTSKVQGLLATGVASVLPFLQGTTAPAQLTDANFANTTSIRVSFSFPV